MKLLILSEDGNLKEKFDPYFEGVDEEKLSRTRVNLLENEEGVLIDSKSAMNYDSLLIIPEPKMTVYVRVLLERLEKNLLANLDSTSSYILLKKQYLYKVLNEKGIPIPKTVVVGSKKGASGIKELNFPVVGRMFEGFEKREMEM